MLTIAPPTDSCMGMGHQPPLAACLSNRRSLLDPISRTEFATTYITPFIDISTRNSSVGPLLAVHHGILALHLARAVQGHCLRLDANDLSGGDNRILLRPSA